MACSALLLAIVTAAPTQDATLVRHRVVVAGDTLELEETRRVDAAGRVQRSVLGADGQWLGGAELDFLRRRAWHEAHAARGKLSPTLAAHLEQVSPTDVIEVAFWLVDDHSRSAPHALLREAASVASPEELPDAVRAARLELLQLATMAHAPRSERLAREVIRAGGEIVTSGTSAPLVVARVRADRVRALALSPDVDEAYRSMPAWFPEGDVAQSTLRTQKAFEGGLSANGSPVKVLVNDTSDVVTGNPYLPPIVQLGTVGFSDSHATAVAGNLANHHPTFAAAASGLPQLYSHAGTGDAVAPGIWDNAIAQGIDFGNCSWWNGLMGQIEFLDRYFDYIVRNFGVMQFKSNGNQGFGFMPYGTTPGQGYNMISTGHYSDSDTVEWEDDAIAGDSSWWNPIEGHQKPELVAPGQGVSTTGPFGPSWLFYGFGGSSSASPMTASVATLLATGQPVLLSQMTTVKALLMASAWHDVSGSGAVSDIDGAGSLHAAAAWAAARDGQWWFGDVTASDFTNDVLEVGVPLLQGDETRVCALWFSNPDSGYTTDVLDMDLDLAVVAPDGTVLASSTSSANPFELTSFWPPVTGTYTVRLTKQRFDGTSEPLTVAWSSRSDSAVATLDLMPGSAPFAVGSTPVLRLSEPFEGSQRAYAVATSVLPPNGVALFNGFTLPTAIDAVTLQMIGGLAMIGQLSFFGEALVPVPIPAQPGLAGLTVYFGGVVFEGPTLNLLEVAMVSDTLTLVVAP